MTKKTKSKESKAKKRTPGDIKVQHGSRGAGKFGPMAMKIIVDAMREGLPITTACGLAEITPRTYYDWLGLARKGDARFVAFRVACAKARAQWERDQVLKISSGVDNWQSQAWLLERVSPGGFAKAAAEKNLPPEELALGAIPLILDALGENATIGVLSDEIERRQKQVLPLDQGGKKSDD